MNAEKYFPLSKKPQKDGMDTKYSCGFYVTGGWATRLHEHKKFCESTIGQWILISESQTQFLQDRIKELERENEALRRKVPYTQGIVNNIKDE